MKSNGRTQAGGTRESSVTKRARIFVALTPGYSAKSQRRIHPVHLVVNSVPSLTNTGAEDKRGKDLRHGSAVIRGQVKAPRTFTRIRVGKDLKDSR